MCYFGLEFLGQEKFVFSGYRTFYTMDRVEKLGYRNGNSKVSLPLCKNMPILCRADTTNPELK